MSHRLPLAALTALAFAAPAPSGAQGQAQGPAARPPGPPDAVAQAIRDRAQWQGNRLGITAAVPPPWTPMTCANDIVGCWGRSYDFRGALFPRQIASAGRVVLAGPITLALSAGGREIVVGRAASQRVRRARHQVDLNGVAVAGPVRVRVQSHVEYDGCIRVGLSLTPANASAVVDNLELRIPVRRDRSTYYHWFEATRDPRFTNAGSLPAAGLLSHFKPLVWLGDDDCGLCWFCESPKGWKVRDKEAAVRVDRTPGASILRVRMVDAPLHIERPWQVVFGLMATPVRPMPDGWRDWLIPLNQTNPWSSWAPGFNNVGGTDDPGTLTPADPAAMARWVRKTQQWGIPMDRLPMREPTKVMPYSQIVFWSGKHRDGTVSPEIRAFGNEWSNQDRPSGPRREPSEQIAAKEYWWVCPQSSFAQFYIWQLNRLIDQTGIDGIYIDGPWNTCANRLHGCGYADSEGKWQPEFKIWAYRELLKRVYCLFYQKRKNPVIHHHTSSWLCMPCISFCHMMLDGEQYHDPGQKVEDHFTDVVPLDKWRAEHTGKQWGPAPFLLPDIPARWCKDEKATRELLMLTDLHDTGLFPAGDNERAVLRNYQARRLFGVARSEFRGYWQNSAWVRCETPGCFVSVYRTGDHARALLVVANTAKEDRTAIVSPNLVGLALTWTAVRGGVDLEDGRRIPLLGGALTLPVKARDFRLIALPAYDPPPLTAGDLRATALTSIANGGFEDGMEGWASMPVEGNEGTVEVDRLVRFSGKASCRIHKTAKPGGIMVQTESVFAVTPGSTCRLDARLRTANAGGAKAYWMVSQLDAAGAVLGTNNLFSPFASADQDWRPFPFEFRPIAGTAAIRVHFLVAFPGTMDAWLDDVKLVALPH